MASAPSTAASPSSMPKRATMILPVLVLWMRTTASSPYTRIRSSSTANGPTAEDMLPQLGRKSTWEVLIWTCANV